MNRGKTFVALAMGALLTVSSLATFAACSKDETTDMTEIVGARICYDNLPDDNIAIAEADTKYALKDASSRVEYDASGAEVANGTVVDYADGVVTAKSTGKAVFTVGKKTFTVEVVPAYVTNPKHQYSNKGKGDYTQASKYLGATHDPSILETVEDGKTVYYICSTGWNFGNEIHRSTDLIHWDYVGKTMSQKTSMRAIAAWEEEDNSSIQWWAPDIVPAYGGGYWLYTCAVSNQRHNDYSKACIVLFYSDTMQAESFRYKGVLMQSAIPSGSAGTIDVNSIDPQIIYSADGKMYMAYGSFGTGNWMLELNPKTGLRKDGFYKNANSFLTVEQVRDYEAEAESEYMGFLRGDVVKSKFYGTLISLRNMEAPVIARHDNVVITDENETVLADAKTYYYSMHSFNPLADAYQMWGGRSESVWGVYRPVNGTAESDGIVYNAGVGSSDNSGNKYTGRFGWTDTVDSNYDVICPGHNDLFTSSTGLDIAAYITRSTDFPTTDYFISQTHQYYLNSMGDIVINPNRYGGEIDRTVTKQELLAYTDGGRFKLVALANDDAMKKSVEVVLTEDGKIKFGETEIGNWKMYGAGYIVINFTKLGEVPMLSAAGQSKYYGVVRPTWLDDQNKSGFTITCMGHDSDSGNISTAMFMNGISTMSGTEFVG